MNNYKHSLEKLKQIVDSNYMPVYKNEIDKHIKALEELVEKETPKKPYLLNYGGYKIENWKCPNCNSIVSLRKRELNFPNRCKYCGQKLDWSEEDE